MGGQTVLFETDSMILKQDISSEKYDLSKLGTPFRKINFKMRVCLNGWQNLIAHGSLMKSGRIETWLGQYFEFVPDTA
jgi:hypothetical protein